MLRFRNTSICVYFLSRSASTGTLGKSRPRRVQREPSGGSPSMSSDVESHVLSRIAAAPIRRDPFAHCVIDEVFPAEFYESVIDHWPEEASWRPLAESGRVARESYAERMVILMTQDGFARLDPMRRAFWQEE